MRRCLYLAALTTTALTTTSAYASPFALRSSEPPAGTSTDAPAADPTAAPAEDPTAAPAVVPPAEETAAPSEPAEEGPQPEEAGANSDAAAGEGSDDPTAEEGEVETLDSARDVVTEETYNQHAIGVRSGLTMVPTWILNSFLASHTNALCRGDQIGNFGLDNGLTRTDGCNFYVGGEYVYRKNRNLDIVASVGYQRMKTPDGYWLDKDEWGDGCSEVDPANGCNLAAADYTELNLSFVFVEADFIGRATVAKGKDLEFQIGGGAGLGIGIIVGKGLYQTLMGGEVNADGQRVPVSPADAAGTPDFSTCTTIQDLGSFQRCTPYYTDDFDIDQDGDGFKDSNGDFRDPGFLPETQGPGQFAECDANGCNASDLQAFGSRFKNEDVPPVIPVVNLILSARLMIKDTVGLNLTGGFQTGFYFGGSLQYFFGKGGGEKKGAVSMQRPQARSQFGVI